MLGVEGDSRVSGVTDYVLPPVHVRERAKTPVIATMLYMQEAPHGHRLAREHIKGKEQLSPCLVPSMP